MVQAVTAWRGEKYGGRVYYLRMTAKKNSKKQVYIMGHRNPDTDSVVSAAAYAELKNLLGKKECIAVRGGKLSPQTEYIF